MPAKAKKRARKRRSDQTSLYVRGLTAQTIQQIKTRAGARAMTNAEYISQLVALHIWMLDASDNAQMQEALAVSGLGRVES